MRRILAPVIVGLLCVVLAVFYHDWQSWLAYETGSRNTQGTPPNYNYWSGFGSVFPWSIGALGALWTLAYQHARKANCHTHGCWRIGSYPVGDYRVCKKHHLQVTGTHPTIEHLRLHYHLRHGKPNVQALPCVTISCVAYWQSGKIRIAHTQLGEEWRPSHATSVLHGLMIT